MTMLQEQHFSIKIRRTLLACLLIVITLSLPLAAAIAQTAPPNPSQPLLTIAAWAPDSKQIAVAGAFGIRLYTNNGLRFSTNPATLRVGIGDIEAITWAPDGRRLAAGSTDHNVYIWNRATGKLL